MSRQDKLTRPQVEDGSPVTPANDDRLPSNLALNSIEAAAVEEELRLSARRLKRSQHLLEFAERVFRARRARDEQVGNALFGEPAWDMLLAMYFLTESRHALDVATLSGALTLSTTATARWLDALIAQGLVAPDVLYPSVPLVRITSLGQSLLERYLINLDPKQGSFGA